MTNPPPWSTTAGFTPPRISSAELRAAKEMPAVQKRQNRPIGGQPLTITLILLVVALVAGAGLLAYQGMKPTSTASPEAPIPTHLFKEKASGVATGPDGKTQPVDVVSSNGPTGHAKSMTATDMANNSLFIPALGVYMPLEGDSAFVASRYSGFDTIEVPANPRHGVWYGKGAPLVGADVGTTLVASHVSQASGWGALRYLYTLRGGEMIYTKDAAGKTQQWQLTQMRVLEHTDFPQEYWSADGVRQLVVVTCGGTISGGHYDKNIFAIATPVGAGDDATSGATT